MQSFVTILDRQDSTAIASFQKALLLTLQENTSFKHILLVNIEGENATLTDWSHDLTGLVASVVSFYGAITRINFTTSKSYTAITPYALSEKICDYLIVYTNKELPSTMSLINFKVMIPTLDKVMSLIDLYSKSVIISNNKETYVELSKSLTSIIKKSHFPLKGLVTVGVEKGNVNISFTTDIERFLSSIFSKANGEDISFGESNPSALIYKGSNPFTYYTFGLKADSETNFGTASSLTVSEFLELHKHGDIIPLTSNEAYTNITSNIVNLLDKYTKQTHSARISSRPLD